MIRIDKIKAGLFGRVGFRQPDITKYAIVSNANIASASGLTFEDASNIVSVPNIVETQVNPDISTAGINTLLERFQQSSILEVCNKVFSGKPDFVNTVNPYPYAKSFKNTIGKGDKFVGIRYTPTSFDMAFIISFAELAFNSTESFNLYVFNSNLSDPIETIEVTTSEGESKVTLTDVLIANETTYKGGCFYVGYFEEDVVGEAYLREHLSSSIPIRTPLLKIDTVSIEHQSRKLDVMTESLHSDTFGLNFGVEVYYDYTDLILKNKAMFDRAIQYQCVIKVLDTIKNSTRSNLTERITKEIIDEANLAIFGNKEAGIKGATQLLDEEISHIRKMLFPKYMITKGTLHR